MLFRRIKEPYKGHQDNISMRKIDQELAKEMFSNTSYIDWLVKFMKERERFADDDWLYFPEKLPESDLNNVYSLHLFFKGINNYAKENYYYATPCEYGGFYKIKYKDYGFKIIFLGGQGTTFICEKINVNDAEEFIDINDIINGRERKEKVDIQEKLTELNQLILDIHEYGVPLEAIRDSVETKLEELKPKPKDNSRKRKRD